MQGIKPSSLYKATYIYLGLPLFVFIVSWLNHSVAFVFSLLFLCAFCKLYTQTNDEKFSYFIPKKIIVTAFFIALFWCFFAGIGYFYYQSWDYHFRNALFRDLINYNWPVFYDKADTPLTYYMGFWLFPALIGKITALFTINQHFVFIFSNFILLLYATFGVTLIFLHIALAWKISELNRFCLFCIFFIFFSGLDIVGYLFFINGVQPFAYHLDWWAGFIQYSSFTTGLFWVFNQFIPVALTVFLILNEHKIRYFALLFTFILFLAPYPAISCAILMIAFTVKQLFVAQKKSYFVISELFSMQNLIAVFGLFPLVFLYFMTNSQGIDRFSFITDTIPAYYVFLFLILECLLYIILIWHCFYKNTFFIAMALFLLVIPWFRFDQQNNFCMRASIPMLIVLAYFCLSYLYKNWHTKNKTFCYFLLFLWLVGSITSIVEFYRGIHYTLETKRLNLVKDEIFTLNQAYVRMPEFGWSANHQFSAKNYLTDIFWQYLAKK